jgi:membrane protein implicated in regulation of membrane protease activity
MSATSEPRDVTSLRGAEAQRLGRRFWLVAGILILAVLAVSIIVSFISAANDNARIDRLKSHGVSVVVTVTTCVGNVGGSGSNAAGYTCRGEYRVDGVTYHEIIGAKTTLSSAGSKVQGVADPARPSTVELASAVATSSVSSSVYVVPTLLLLLFVALSVASLRRWRRSVPRTSATSTPSN